MEYTNERFGVLETADRNLLTILVLTLILGRLQVRPTSLSHKDALTDSLLPSFFANAEVNLPV
jgi:hypothetical protein